MFYRFFIIALISYLTGAIAIMNNELPIRLEPEYINCGDKIILMFIVIGLGLVGYLAGRESKE